MYIKRLKKMSIISPDGRLCFSHDGDLVVKEKKQQRLQGTKVHQEILA